ncbi:hypothetical protein [Motilimonas pumila]|uniref:Uncharacterized protein n=1 Tax=Motilimonas pumila TaxID=2303987 RepID=A0A418YA07_9GAMM|nr:hypothetical protein [Motilimonas pumila]RJG38769.1 hypothetical protein D1Z90_18670 [Motilimonas pumila]
MKRAQFITFFKESAIWLGKAAWYLLSMVALVAVNMMREGEKKEPYDPWKEIAKVQMNHDLAKHDSKPVYKDD